MKTSDYYERFRPRLLALPGGQGVLGSFSPRHSTVSFHPAIEKKLERGWNLIEGSDSFDSMPIYRNHFDDADFDAILTYFHETMHWWQYIGSTFGFISTLSTAAQTFGSVSRLSRIDRHFPLSKPLTRQVLEDLSPNQERNPNKAVRNTLVNTWMDIEFAYALLHNPTSFAREIRDDKFFDSAGSSYCAFYGEALQLISTACFPGSNLQPDDWYERLYYLQQVEAPDFSYQAPLRIPSLGAYELLEGQARFQELQLLYSVVSLRGGNADWRLFRNVGLLGQSYTKAFEHFLRLTSLDWPDSPVSSTVNLFLLLCDIALNPSYGYPIKSDDLERLPESVHPGVRFLRAAEVIRNYPDLASSIKNGNDAEYAETADTICRKAGGWLAPSEIASAVLKLVSENPMRDTFFQDYLANAYGETNPALRFLGIRHWSFMEAKSRSPACFCWPGLQCVMNAGDIDVDPRGNLATFSPPFVRSTSDEGFSLRYMFPPGTVSDVKRADKIINDFFTFQIFVDTVRQLVASSGPFILNYWWIHPDLSWAYFEQLIEGAFTRHGVRSLSEFRIDNS